MGTSFEVHIAKPGGKREGPFSLDEINLALAAKKYLPDDYWAWHEGLPQWVPLYEIKGITKVSTSEPAPKVDPKAVADNSAPEQATGSDPEVQPPATELAPKEQSMDKTPAEVKAKEAGEDETRGAEYVTGIGQSVVKPTEEDEPESESGFCESKVSNESSSERAANPALETAADNLVPDVNNQSSTARPEEATAGPEDEYRSDAANDPPPGGSDESLTSAMAEEDGLTSLDAAGNEDEYGETEAGERDVTTEQPLERSSVENNEEQAVNEFCAEVAPEQPLSETAGNSDSETTAHELVPETEFSKTEANDLVARTESAAAILARLKESLRQRSSSEQPAGNSSEVLRELPSPTNEATSFFNAERVNMPGLAVPRPAIPSSPEDNRDPSESESVETETGFEAGSSDFQSTAVPQEPKTAAQADEVKRLADKFSSGMPFEALEQIFIFTTGDASVWNSSIVGKMLEAIVGEKLEVIRRSTPRDVIFNCDLSQLLKRDGAISDAVWRAMAIREPSVIARAQQKLCHTCVRTFQTDTNTVAALILLYNTQKLPRESQAQPKANLYAGPAFARSPGSSYLR